MLIVEHTVAMNYQDQITSNKLKSQRKDLQCRQQDIAETLGFCTTDRISHWEKGVAIPSIINLFRLSAFFKVMPHELYPDLYQKIWNEVNSSQLKKDSN